MPRNKVSGYCYKEFREEFNTSDKKKKTWHFELSFLQCTWPYCQMCNPYQKQLLRAGLYSHWAWLPRRFSEGKTKAGFGKAGVRIKQEGCAILREEGLFHRSLSPHQPRLPERILLTTVFSEAPSIICLYIFQQIPPVICFRRNHLQH